MKVFYHKFVILLTLFLCYTISFNVHAQNSLPMDMVFVMDGSGSIDEDDFEIQKIGIINALGNRDVFPRNGTIGFALIQFDDIARVEVDYQVINSEDGYPSNFVCTEFMVFVGFRKFKYKILIIN